MTHPKEDRLFTLVSRVATGMTILLITHLWNRVDALSADSVRRDQELAKYFLEIESRLTRVETRMEDV